MPFWSPYMRTRVPGASAGDAGAHSPLDMMGSRFHFLFYNQLRGGVSVGPYFTGCSGVFSWYSSGVKIALRPRVCVARPKRVPEQARGFVGHQLVLCFPCRRTGGAVAVAASSHSAGTRERGNVHAISDGAASSKAGGKSTSRPQNFCLLF